MVIVLFFVFQWYLSLFCQSFFMHRYGAHRVCEMSPFWEKFFFIAAWITQGSSYLSAHNYALMHRMHHALADTKDDPHSPKYSKNLFSMMWDTKKRYDELYYERTPIDEKYRGQLPSWPAFDRFAHGWPSRIFWMICYIVFWYFFATAWWQWLLLPLTMVISPLQGAIINYFAHVVGYRNFKMKNTSTNLYPIFDLFLWGESYHNNHHKFAGRPDFAHKWFEWDPLFSVMKVMNFFGVIRMKPETP